MICCGNIIVMTVIMIMYLRKVVKWSYTATIVFNVNSAKALRCHSFHHNSTRLPFAKRRTHMKAFRGQQRNTVWLTLVRLVRRCATSAKQIDSSLKIWKLYTSSPTTSCWASTAYNSNLSIKLRANLRVHLFSNILIRFVRKNANYLDCLSLFLFLAKRTMRTLTTMCTQ